MDEKLIIYKNLGETPLQALERTRTEKGISKNIPMTYAGRLDPMAEGLMIVLTGEECKNKEAYLGLDKTYEFEMLAGFSTDTYDLLGMVADMIHEKEIPAEDIKKYLNERVGTFTQSYPPYSSKTFKGKQLHTHAREGNAPLMEHEVELFSFEFLEERNVSSDELLKMIQEKIGLVSGDFRQEQILKKWNEVVSAGAETGLPHRITSCRVSVSSGFYIRQLVQDIGMHFHVPMTTFAIKRTKVGGFEKANL